MRRWLQSVIIATAIAGVSAGAAAGDKKGWVADALRGKRISQRLCATCHIVGVAQSTAVIAGVPSFRELAKLPDHRITRTLIVPHKLMPNMQLTRNEISDIIAYITDLRRKDAGKPPIDKSPRQKPKYPSPS